MFSAATSFTMTAILCPASFSAIRFKSFVLPDPRKPESTVTGGFLQKLFRDDDGTRTLLKKRTGKGVVVVGVCAMMMILCAELITGAKKCVKVWERGACRVLLRRVHLRCTLFHHHEDITKNSLFKGACAGYSLSVCRVILPGTRLFASSSSKSWRPDTSSRFFVNRQREHRRVLRVRLEFHDDHYYRNNNLSFDSRVNTQK
jgi:hypothetical protein